MNYQETIKYLFEQLPMFSRLGAAAYKQDLTNTLSLCSFLENPQSNLRFIHVAGTNGKGSTSHMLAAILQQAGYKTGLYTSPHLKDFRERIRIDGQWIDADFVIDYVERTRQVCDAIQPSFFELTVAMAFDYFRKNAVDIAVIETGLGGRLDSTNVIHPLLSIITNIGYDHMNLLGDTLEKIASEKAGIIKNQVPVVIGSRSTDTQAVFLQKASEMKAPIFFAEDMCRIDMVSSDDFSLHFRIHDLCGHTSFECNLDLPGHYQQKNLATVVAAVNQLNQMGFGIHQSHMKTALSNVKGLTGLGGRWECIGLHPKVILDVAHNEDGIKHVLQQIEKEESTHFIMGMVRDKEVETVLKLMPLNARYYFTQAAIPRALPADEFRQKAVAAGLSGDSYENVMEALAAARALAKPDDLIVVLGSVFLVGEVVR